MASYRVQMTLGTADNNPSNYITNTWACAAIGDTECQDFVSALITFYRSCTTLFPSTIRQNNHIFKAYDMLDPEPRAPRLEGTWNFTTAPASDPLPPEVAMCLSFQAPKVSGVPQARRRGRVYIGPLRSIVSSGGRPSSSAITTLRDAGEALRAAGVASAGDWNWAVYSTVLGGTADVTSGWVDDEFDTQRRRGRLPTTRNVFP